MPDGQGNDAAGQRLYQLIRQPQPIADRQFGIAFLDPGVEAFVCTFGRVTGEDHHAFAQRE